MVDRQPDCPTISQLDCGLELDRGTSSTGVMLLFVLERERGREGGREEGRLLTARSCM